MIRFKKQDNGIDIDSQLMFIPIGGKIDVICTHAGEGNNGWDWHGYKLKFQEISFF